MDTNEKKTYPQKHNSVEQIIKKMCDSNGEDLVKLMEWAKQQAESDSSLENPSIPEAPKDEFSIILEKMKNRNIKPGVMADFDEESQKAYNSRSFLGMRMELDRQDEKRFEELKESYIQLSDSNKKYSLQPLKAVGVAAACFCTVAIVILLKPGIDVVGQKAHQYHSMVRGEGKDDVVWDNQEDYIADEGYLKNIYDEIKEKLGIAMLKLNYIPKNMYLSEVSIESGFAKLKFIYNDTFVYMFEVLYSVDNSGDRFSDRKIFTTVKNEWLGKEIPIKRNQISTGQYEYNAYIEIDNAYYYLEGIMEENEFLNIVAGLSLEQ